MDWFNRADYFNGKNFKLKTGEREPNKRGLRLLFGCRIIFTLSAEKKWGKNSSEIFGREKNRRKSFSSQRSSQRDRQNKRLMDLKLRRISSSETAEIRSKLIERIFWQLLSQHFPPKTIPTPRAGGIYLFRVRYPLETLR
jgi:hypothetical protein